jgi:hypothetical protein
VKPLIQAPHDTGMPHALQCMTLTAEAVDVSSLAEDRLERDLMACLLMPGP